MTVPHAAWDTAGFRASVESTLLDFVGAQAEWLAELGPDADRFVAHARTSVTGGKRLRAAFCWWGHHAVDDTPLDAATERALLRACGALELLHASALVHDDLMDASDTRRGHPSTHRAFERLHRQEGWTGGATEYGAAAAILLGDLLLSWSDELLRTSGLPAGRVLEALRFLDLTRSEVVTGQFLDVSAQARGKADVDTAMTVLRYKSAKYSVERPLHVGAALGGASAAQVSDLTRFGLPLGEAFQLRDDVLGVFGDPAATGKPAGDDLVEGKRTVLVALALDALPTAQGRRLDAALGTPLDPAQVGELRDLISSSGALAQLESVIEHLTGTALAALERADVADTARSALARLADEATQRTV